MLDWEQLRSHWTGPELWKTPTKYLVCVRYERIFRFFDNLKDAQQTFEEMKAFREQQYLNLQERLKSKRS